MKTHLQHKTGLTSLISKTLLLLFSCSAVSTLGDHMDWSTPGFPVRHHLLEFAQVHVHGISDGPRRLILWCSLLLPSIFPSIRDFSSELSVCIRWSKYWSFSLSISPSSEYSGLICLKIDWFDLLAVQGIFRTLLQHHNWKASILWHSAFFKVQLSQLLSNHWEDHILVYTNLCRQSHASAFQHTV